MEDKDRNRSDVADTGSSPMDADQVRGSADMGSSDMSDSDEDLQQQQIDGNLGNERVREHERE